MGEFRRLGTWLALASYLRIPTFVTDRRWMWEPTKILESNSTKLKGVYGNLAGYLESKWWLAISIWEGAEIGDHLSFGRRFTWTGGSISHARTWYAYWGLLHTQCRALCIQK